MKSESKPAEREVRILCAGREWDLIETCKMSEVKSNSEILVQGEGFAWSGGFGARSGGRRSIDSSLSVIRYTLLEEVGLALKRDHIHKVEGVRHGIDLVVSKSHKESVSDELYVLAH